MIKDELNNLSLQFLSVIKSVTSLIKMVWLKLLLDIIISVKTLTFYWRKFIYKFVYVLRKVSSILKHIIIGHPYRWLILTIIACIIISVFFESWYYADYCWISVQIVLMLTILTNLNEKTN
jgi:hypothetical protein